MHLVEPSIRLVLKAHGGPLRSATTEIDLSDDGDGCRLMMREEPIKDRQLAA